MTDEQKQRNIMLAEALESGEYTQTVNSLRKDDSYCCLGVACELYRKATGLGEWKPENAFYPFAHLHMENDSQLAVAPSVVADWYGWKGKVYDEEYTTGNPALSSDLINALTAWSGTPVASFLNDKGYAFPVIATGFREMAK